MRKNLVLYLVLLSIMLSACSTASVQPADQSSVGEAVSGDTAISQEKAPEQAEQAGQTDTRQPVVSGQADDAQIRQAESYAEVYAALSAAYTSGLIDTEENASDAVEPEQNGDFSETNIQVPGYDEADIVKTDGRYLYILTSDELLVVSADAGDSEVAGKITLTGDYGTGSYSESAAAMYLDGSTAIVILSHYAWNETLNEDGDYVYSSKAETVIKYYDVTDPSDIRHTATFAQDGWYSDSRLRDGKLYVCSSYDIWNFSEQVPEQYIPCVYTSGSERLLRADEIYLTEPCALSSYTVVSLLDGSGVQQKTVALTGTADAVYMNDSGLYLAMRVRSASESEPYQENQYTVTDYTSRAMTGLFRLSAEDLGILGAGAVDGYLLNSYAMDEYNGYLRLVTTQSSYSYKVYEDKAYGFTNYVSGESVQGNALYVLSADLSPVSGLTGLAEDERVYSVRFLDSVVYFVTFRETDPLFAVDLSDPASPCVLSELKIDGFSSYLHPYGDGLLFGLGQNVNASTGWPDGLKLSMFDISDPSAVTELTRLVLEGSDSEALYNYHAILVAPERDLVAFPTDSGYVVYGYSDGRFEQRGSFDLERLYYSGARGVYIGDTFYICTNASVTAVDLQNMHVLGTLALALG